MSKFIKPLIITIIIGIGISSEAQTGLFTSGSPISPFGSVNSPGGENYTRIRDGNINTKYLDFNRNDGMGFTVDIGTSITARVLSMSTANDSSERDPRFFTISGSNNNAAFTTIATVNIPCVGNRFFTRNFNFNNNTAYRYYRIVYNTVCANFANSIQVAETQIFYPVSNVFISANGSCAANNDATFTTQFNVVNGTGNYEVYATAANANLGINIGDVLGSISGAATTANGLSILSTLSGPILSATTLSVNVRDTNTGGDAPVGNIRTVNIPICYPISNTAITVDGICDSDYGVVSFSAQFDTSNGSGEYAIIVATANVDLGLNPGDNLSSISGAALSGTAISINGEITGSVAAATTLDINIVDTGLIGNGLIANIQILNIPECIATIPTLNQWGLIILALLLLN